MIEALQKRLMFCQPTLPHKFPTVPPTGIADEVVSETDEVVSDDRTSTNFCYLTIIYVRGNFQRNKLALIGSVGSVGGGLGGV